MVADVGEIVLPENVRSLHQKEARHLPWIADYLAGQMPLGGCAQAARHYAWTEHLTRTTAFEAERTVKHLRWIGDGTRLRPGCGEEFFTLSDRTHVEKEQRWVCRVGDGQGAKIFHQFPAEGSAKVTQENEHGRRLA